MNGHKFDLRLHLPKGIEELKKNMRRLINAAMARESITLSLRLERASEAAMPRVDTATLSTALDAVTQAKALATAHRIVLAPTTGTTLLGLRSVLKSGPTAAQASSNIAAALLDNLPALIADFDSMHLRKNAALARLLAKQIDQINALVAAAQDALPPRHAHMAEALREAVAQVQGATPQADAARLEQELALITVKSNITEELDRLHAHITTTPDLLAKSRPIGHKLDFLAQEFNREANTLCAKSQSTELTRIRLDLKAVINQMREQVQNVE